MDILLDPHTSSQMNLSCLTCYCLIENIDLYLQIQYTMTLYRIISNLNVYYSVVGGEAEVDCGDDFSPGVGEPRTVAVGVGRPGDPRVEISPRLYSGLPRVEISPRLHSGLPDRQRTLLAPLRPQLVILLHDRYSQI